MGRLIFNHEMARIREESQSQVAIVRGRFWHLPAIYAQIYDGALEGNFSYGLADEKIQLFMLLTMLCVSLFGYVKLPGVQLSKARLRVAESNGMVVGHVFLIQHHDSLEIATCAVKTEYRRNGIGKMLVDDTVALAGNLPVKAACMPKSHAMCMVLRKCGFVTIKRLSPNQIAKLGLRHWQHSQSS